MHSTTAAAALPTGVVKSPGIYALSGAMKREKKNKGRKATNGKPKPFSELSTYCQEPQIGWQAWFQQRQEHQRQHAWNLLIDLVSQHRSIYSADPLNDYYEMISRWLENLFTATFCHSIENYAEYHLAF
jgi:hypothetical protein